MDMELVKSCPQCGGTIYRYLSRYDGWHEECFQCGYSVQPVTKMENNYKSAEKKSNIAV